MKAELLAYLRSIDKRLDALGEYAADGAGMLAKIEFYVDGVRSQLGNLAAVPEDLRVLLSELKAMRLELRHQMENADEQGARIKHLEAKIGQR